MVQNSGPVFKRNRGSRDAGKKIFRSEYASFSIMDFSVSSLKNDFLDRATKKSR